MSAPECLIDWERPIVAVPTVKFAGGRLPSVTVDRSFAARDDAVAIRVDQNIFVVGGPTGTWYFNHKGLAVGGMTPDGYDARFTLCNA